MSDMRLKDIYARDIGRDINPAVVVSDDQEQTIRTEIEEYVFTDDLLENIYRLLNSVLNRKSGKNGIWINGYYGSGKSHFIKYIHYLLDPMTAEMAFERLEKAVADYDTMRPGGREDLTVSNVKLLKKRATAGSCDDILFNVEDETDDGSGERMTRIFLSVFNKFRGYNSNDIALALLLEKTLDRKGSFEAFKKKIQDDLHHDWETDASQVAAFQLQTVLELAKEVEPSLDIKSLHGKLSDPDAFRVTINDTLIPELTDFLKDKDDKYRLLFLVDEISQYIGSNKEILLNFQNIVERISLDCGDKVWIACTAQQSLDQVSSGVEGLNDVRDEFGKILGRFETENRISLQSNDASYITQRRVLDKNSDGIEVLEKMYDGNKDYIENQFKINHDLYKGFQGPDQFVSAYPFVPYQFRLIQDVFEAFQKLGFVITEVKDNERSVLGITHFTAKEYADEEVGGFIPFDAFYNRQLHTNLRQTGSRAIQSALDLDYVKGDPFAQRVVKVLFMVSNLLENKRQTFPSSIDNLTVLLMDELDQNRMQLQQKVKEVLDRLMDKGIIREEGGSYFFFNEDEMDVQNIIKSLVVNADERWETFDKIFRPMVRLVQKHSYGHGDFKLAYRVEQKEFIRNGDFEVTVLLNDDTEIAAKALDVSKKDLVICINEWFRKDEMLRKDLDRHCRTNKYFIQHGRAATGTRSKTNENFQVRNNELKSRIEQRIKERFPQTRFISQQTIIESDQISGVNPQDRFKNLLDHHLAGIYKHHEQCLEYARTQQDLKRSAADGQIPAPMLTAAEKTVNDYISQHNDRISVNDLIAQFEKEPYGWPHMAVLDVLVHLVKKKQREFVYQGTPRYPIVDFINKAVSTAERSRCEVVTGESISQEVLDDTIRAYRHIFNESLTPSSDGNELFDYLIKALEKTKEYYTPYQKNYFGVYPFGAVFNEVMDRLNEWTTTRDPKTLFDRLLDAQDDHKELADRAKGIADFTDQHLRAFKELRQFHEAHRDDVVELPLSDQQKAGSIRDTLESKDPRKLMRHAMKAKEELAKAITALGDHLREKVLVAYSEVFDQLEAEANKLGVGEEDYVNRATKTTAIDHCKSISGLRRFQLEAQNFKADELKKILAAVKTPEGEKASEPEAYYMTKGATVIRSEEELEAYITQVRSDMQAMLKDNKTIILK